MAGKILNKRVDMLGFIKVEMANPNGNPDCENEPRALLNGYGYMTDVSLKYKIREAIEQKFGDRPGFARFIKGDGITLETKTNQVVDAYCEANGIEKENLKKLPDAAKHLHKAMTDAYFDLRMFGGVLTAMTKNKWTDGKINGPVQVSYANSLDVISPIRDTITCVSVASDEEKEKDGKDRNMGSKWMVPYAIYQFEVHISGAIAEKIGMTEEDLQILTEAIWNMYDMENSASKTGMDVVRLYVFQHDSKFGNCKFSKLKDAVAVSSDFEEGTFDAELNEAQIPASVTVKTYR